MFLLCFIVTDGGGGGGIAELQCGDVVLSVLLFVLGRPASGCDGLAREEGAPAQPPPQPH